jgi:hypothetical protein
MARARLLLVLLLAALAIAASAPAASAHTAVTSVDGRVRGSIGLLDEPVSTYAVTGLDVCFTHNTAAPRTPIAGINPGNFSATLKAPSGATHTAALEVPFGRPNCLTFETPLVLTESGQYLVDLSGALNGTTIDVKDVKAGGEVVDREEITFPATVASDEELQGRIAALESKVAALQADEAGADGGGEKGAPAPVAALTFLLLAVLAAARRLR